MISHTKSNMGKKIIRKIVSAEKGSDRDANLHEKEMKRLQEEENKTLTRLQSEYHKVKHDWSRLANRPLSFRNVSMASYINQDNLADIQPSDTEHRTHTPGTMYRSNGSTRGPSFNKLQTLGKAHTALLQQLRVSQKTFENSVKRFSHVHRDQGTAFKRSFMTASPITTPPAPLGQKARKSAPANSIMLPRAERNPMNKPSTTISQTHACRGIGSKYIYKQDCKQCTRLINTRIVSLVKSQDIAISKRQPSSKKLVDDTIERPAAERQVYRERSLPTFLHDDKLRRHATLSTKSLPSHSPSTLSNPVEVRRKLSAGNFDNTVYHQLNRLQPIHNQLNNHTTQQAASESRNKESKVSFYNVVYRSISPTTNEREQNFSWKENSSDKCLDKTVETQRTGEISQLNPKRVMKLMKVVARKEELRVNAKVGRFLEDLDEFIRMNKDSQRKRQII